MKEIQLVLPRDRWKKNFDRTVAPASLGRRFFPEGEDVLLGRRKEDGFFLYEKKKGRFALLPPMLKGKLLPREGKTGLKLRFVRPVFPGILLFLWALLMMGSGVLFLVSEFPLFLMFFFPGVLGILPFLWYTQRSKRVLFAALEKILEQDGLFLNE